MKKLLAVLAVALLGTTACAEPRPMLSVSECNTDSNDMLEVIQERYGEQPFALGIGNILEGTTMQVVTGNMMMFVNPDTLTYTIALMFGDDTMCIVTSGEDFKPAFVLGDRS